MIRLLRTMHQWPTLTKLMPNVAQTTLGLLGQVSQTEDMIAGTDTTQTVSQLAAGAGGDNDDTEEADVEGNDNGNGNNNDNGRQTEEDTPDVEAELFQL